MKKLLLIALLLPVFAFGQFGRLPYKTLLQAYRGDTAIFSLETTNYEISTNKSNFSFNKPLIVRDTSLNDLIEKYGTVYPPIGIPLSTGSSWGISITNNSANWNTAYGWGNHAGLYKLISDSTDNHGFATNYKLGLKQDRLFANSGLYFDSDTLKLGYNPINASTSISGSADLTISTLGGFFANIQDGVKYNTINVNNPNSVARIDFSTSDGNSTWQVNLEPGRGLKYEVFDTDKFGDSTLVNKRWVSDLFSTGGWIRQTEGKIFTSDSVGIKKAIPMYDFDVDGTAGALEVFTKRINFGENVLIGDSTAFDWLNQGLNANVFIGYKSGKDAINGANANTAIGFLSGSKLNASYGNTLIGDYAGALGDFTGILNTGMGSGVLGNNTTGSENAVFGSASLQNNTTGNNNTVLGSNAANNITTGSDNIYIGDKTGLGDANTDSTVIIGGLGRAKEFAPFSSKMAEDIRDQNSNIAGNLNVQGILSIMGISLDSLFKLATAAFIPDTLPTGVFMYTSSDSIYTPSLTQNVFSKFTPSFIEEDCHNLTCAGDSIINQKYGDFISDMDFDASDGVGSDFEIQIRVDGQPVFTRKFSTNGTGNYVYTRIRFRIKNLAVNSSVSHWIRKLGTQNPDIRGVSWDIKRECAGD